MNFRDALIKCFSASDEVSFGRVASGLALIACLSWDTFFVIFAALKLDLHLMNIHDILPTTDQLHGQILFCSGAYAINKATELVTAFSQYRKGPQ